MRGAQDRHRCQAGRSRIIPADAGSTDLRAQSFIMLEDHPRGCGEHSTGCRKPRLRQGSSPRMRGAPIQENVYALKTGIIPADAGSTMTMGTIQDNDGDHPRGCGEHHRDDLLKRL